MDHARLWSGAGWEPVWVDGHDVAALADVLGEEPSARPRVVLARTVKGKGVTFMEGNIDWHHGRLTDEQAHDALGQTGALS